MTKVLYNSVGSARVGEFEWPDWHCPNHKDPLKKEGRVFACPKGDEFRIRNEIPRFVTSSYADAFAPEAKKLGQIQLDSYTRTTITQDRARRCIGEELWSQLSGKQVLEAGCGAGRFTEILLNRGAFVTSIDITEAIDANKENFPLSDHHRVAQADLESLPFTPGQFDVVFCVGVIQHTPNPERSMSSLYQQVRPGGILILDHYTHSLSWQTKTAALLRHLFRRLPPEQSLNCTEKIVDILLPLHKMVGSFRLGQMLLSRVSPVVCYYQVFPELGDNLQREWALLDTHGSLTHWHRHVRTRRQIRRTLEQLGLQEIWCEYGGNGVEARGRCPLP